MTLTISLPGDIAIKYSRQLSIHCDGGLRADSLRPSDTINLIVEIDIKNSSSQLIQNILKNEDMVVPCALRG